MRLRWDWVEVYFKLSWGWVEIEAEVDLSLRLKWGWIEVEVGMRSSLVGADLKFSDLHWYENEKMSLICSFIYVTIWTCHHLKIIIYFISFHICHHLNMSPSEKFSNLSPSWYENRRFRFSYRAFRWWQMSPSESLVWKVFIPVTKKCFQMVTVW